MTDKQRCVPKAKKECKRHPMARNYEGAPLDPGPCTECGAASLSIGDPSVPASYPGYPQAYMLAAEPCKPGCRTLEGQHPKGTNYAKAVHGPTPCAEHRD